MDPIFSQQFNMGAPKQGRGMFANADWQSAMMAAGAAMMARTNPVAAKLVMESLQTKQQTKQREQEYQRQRADQNADWIGHQEYEAAHQQPAMTERFVTEILDPNTDPARRELLKSVIVPPAPAPMTMTTPQGTYIGQRSEMPAAAGPPPGAVNMLKSNPHLAPVFDQKYGPGSSARILGAGGPSPGGSGGFL